MCITGVRMPHREAPSIDTRPRDVNGNLLKTGIDPSEGIIGPDDTPKFGQKPAHYDMRTEDTYPNFPSEAKRAELSFVLPMANFLAHTLNIDIIDEIMYDKTLKQLRQRMLFVVMNMHNLKTQDGMSWWDGIVLMCKTHPVVLVRFKMHLASRKIGIAFIKVWNSSKKVYVLYGDKEQRQLMTRERASRLILDYLNHEGIVKV